MRPQQPEVDGTYRRKTTGLQLTLKNREVIRATSFQNPVKLPAVPHRPCRGQGEGRTDNIGIAYT